MPYPGFEPGTFGAAACFPRRYTAWSARLRLDYEYIIPENYTITTYNYIYNYDCFDDYSISVICHNRLLRLLNV